MLCCRDCPCNIALEIVVVKAWTKWMKHGFRHYSKHETYFETHTVHNACILQSFRSFPAAWSGVSRTAPLFVTTRFMGATERGFPLFRFHPFHSFIVWRLRQYCYKIATMCFASLQFTWVICSDYAVASHSACDYNSLITPVLFNSKLHISVLLSPLVLLTFTEYVYITHFKRRRRSRRRKSPNAHVR